VQVHQRIQASFHTRFSLIELYAHPTVGSIAEYLLYMAAPAAEDAKENKKGTSQREALIRQKRLNKQKRH